MVVVMELTASEQEISEVKTRLESLGFGTHIIRGVERIVIGAIGDRKVAESIGLERMAGVEKVVPIMQPYKLVSREAKPENSQIKIGDCTIGGPELVVMAGPCAVEDEAQIYESAKVVKASGGQILRGGTFKPRTSPYSFQGLEEEGLRILAGAAKEHGLLSVTEVIDTRSLEVAANYVDMLQIGARNMQNFQLLREAGRCGKPVLLKRGLSATIEEWLMAAEYIISEGNYRIILCERGIRTFETATRNTLDVSAVPVAKQRTHLPVIVDPSHAAGDWRLVNPLTKASIAAGADGVIVEIHPNPQSALCDGPQSLTPQNFTELMHDIKKLAVALGREAGTNHGDEC